MNTSAPRRKKILIADDHPDTVEVVQFTLEQRGFELFTADNGLLAITQACHHLPDAVVLDIGLPVVDGLEVAKDLRRNAALEGTTIIGCSARSHEDYLLRAQESHFDYFLLKPFEIETLEACIEPEKHVETLAQEVADFSTLSLELRGRSLLQSAKAYVLSERSRKARAKAREICGRLYRPPSASVISAYMMMPCYLELTCDHCKEEHEVYFLDGPPQSNDTIRYLCPVSKKPQVIQVGFVIAYHPAQQIPTGSITGTIHR